MAALDAAATRRTRAHVDAKLADDGTDHRQIFLILRDDVRAVYLAATCGTRHRQSRIVGLIDTPGHGALAVATVGRTPSPARRTAGALAMGLGEGGGLPEARPPRRVELIPEPLVAALQSIALVLRARQRIAQPSNLCVLSLDQRVAGVRRRRRAHLGHASVMPESRNLYKYDILDRRRSGDETR